MTRTFLLAAVSLTVCAASCSGGEEQRAACGKPWQPPRAGPPGVPRRLPGRRDHRADLVDLPVDDAVIRLEREYLVWGVRFAPLPPSDAPSLFAAYRVQTQTPRPGQRQRQLEQQGSTTSVRGIGLDAVPAG